MPIQTSPMRQARKSAGATARCQSVALEWAGTFGFCGDICSARVGPALVVAAFGTHLVSLSARLEGFGWGAFAFFVSVGLDGFGCRAISTVFSPSAGLDKFGCRAIAFFACASLMVALPRCLNSCPSKTVLAQCQLVADYNGDENGRKWCFWLLKDQ